MSVYGLACTLVLAVSLVFSAVVLGAHKRVLIAMKLALFTYYFLARSVIVALGWDGLFPSELFASSPDQQLAGTASLYLAAWVCSMTFCCRLVLGWRSTVRFLVPRYGKWSTPRIERCVVVGSAASVVISGILLVSFGGFAGLARANKFDKAFAGFFFVKLIPQTTATLALVVGFQRMQQRRAGEGKSPWPFLIAAVGNGATLFLIGARTVLAFTVVCVVLGSVVFGFRSASKRGLQKRQAMGLLAAAAVGLVLLVGLRDLRDDAITRGGGQTTVEHAVRRVSVQTNLTYFDSFVLATRDWPSIYPFRGGSEIAGAFTAPIPRSIWAGKPRGDSAVWFKQKYLPGSRNGWPSGAPGEWYLSFGVVGLLVGGALSGAAFGTFCKRLRRPLSDPRSFVLSMVLGLQVASLGVGYSAFSAWVLWIGPLLVLDRFLSPRRRRVSPASSSVRSAAQSG